MRTRNVFSAFSYALTRHVRLRTQTVRLQPSNCVGHEEELRLHRTRLQLAAKSLAWLHRSPSCQCQYQYQSLLARRRTSFVQRLGNAGFHGDLLTTFENCHYIPGRSPDFGTQWTRTLSLGSRPPGV